MTRHKPPNWIRLSQRDAENISVELLLPINTRSFSRASSEFCEQRCEFIWPDELPRPSPLQGLLHLSCDTNFPPIYNLSFATVQAGKAGSLFLFFFLSFYILALISLIFSGQSQRKASFSPSQLVIISSQEATGVFQQKHFMTCYFQQRCSLLWTLLCLA